jgi:hypothetical protein
MPVTRTPTSRRLVTSVPALRASLSMFKSKLNLYTIILYIPHDANYGAENRVSGPRLRPGHDTGMTNTETQYPSHIQNCSAAVPA